MLCPDGKTSIDGPKEKHSLYLEAFDRSISLGQYELAESCEVDDSPIVIQVNDQVFGECAIVRADLDGSLVRLKLALISFPSS